MAEASRADPIELLLPPGRRNLANLTNLARKYTHPVKTIGKISHRVLKNTGKSGLTPITPNPRSHNRIATPLLTPNSLPSRLVEKYQTRRFYGFSAEELQTLNAITGLDNQAGDSTLDEMIHPLFAEAKWERSDGMGLNVGPLPIRGGIDGYWVADNPIVWNALKPSIYLASLLINNAAVYPWWDALFFGDYHDIPSHRKGPQHQSKRLKSFHTRPLHIREQPMERGRVDAQFRVAAQAIRFRIWSGYTNYATGLAIKEPWVCGATSWELSSNNIRINIALELIQPLLSAQLNAAERMACQFRIASTLVHETAHAMWEYKRNTDPDPEFHRLDAEPYFEGEVLAELGWSLEDKLWGGEPMDILANSYSRGGPGLASAGFFKTNWFVDRHKDYSAAPLLEHVVHIPPHDDPYYRHDYYPLSTSWFRSLFDRNLWDSQARQFRASATKMQPCYIGTTANYVNRQTEHEQIDSFTRQFDGTGVLAVSPGAPAVEQARITAEISRRNHANDIFGRMRVFVPVVPVTEEPPDDPDPPEPVYTCARWDEIAQYLFDHRDPDDLALDTLDFPMPEQNLYKNVYDYGMGMPGITPEELRDFLRVCHQRKLLFGYTPFPAGGTVHRLPTGWPERDAEFQFVREGRTNPMHIANLDALIRDPAFQHRLYAEYGDYRDIYYEHLRLAMQRLGARTNTANSSMRFGEMRSVVNSLATGNYITIGPRGSARMIWPIAQAWRDKYQRDATMRILADGDAMVRAARDQAARLEQAGSERELGVEKAMEGEADDEKETETDEQDSTGVGSDEEGSGVKGMELGWRELNRACSAACWLEI
ncbi:uncharacterized protein L3040_005772 [Drepanopeziza brunnea f. sp. 'multigermtubi']|uniref:uncharacterized protein n=1 Tax=Drepanopeziza brunnea f. sp. 'multigermtubi' TaxID=698441 RepID=UPI0023A27AA7|nr:hypothetical protein L3040_005772 [Drepanopeziza brunnea f. sp. 'multigermtubi']